MVLDHFVHVGGNPLRKFFALPSQGILGAEDTYFDALLVRCHAESPSPDYRYASILTSSSLTFRASDVTIAVRIRDTLAHGVLEPFCLHRLQDLVFPRSSCWSCCTSPRSCSTWEQSAWRSSRSCCTLYRRRTRSHSTLRAYSIARISAGSVDGVVTGACSTLVPLSFRTLSTPSRLVVLPRMPSAPIG